jgi:hypothetical protein
MRRISGGLVGLSLFALITSVFLAGCGGGTDSRLVSGDQDNRGGKGGPTSKAASGGPIGGPLEPVKGQGLATLRGKITLKGGDPASRLSQLTDELLAQMKTNPDKDYCVSGSEAERTQQMYRIGANKQVGNVAVFLQAPKGQFFPIDQKQLDEAKEHPVIIDQPHCAFLPRIAVSFPFYHADPKKPKELKPTGQELKIKNSAMKTHNTNYRNGNPNIPGGSPPQELKVVADDVSFREPIFFKCNIHGWMQAYLWVLDNPYSAVSRSDTSPNPVKADDASFGTYEIKNIPAGAKVKLWAWHETAKFLKGGNGDEIELKPGDNMIDFELEVK